MGCISMPPLDSLPLLRGLPAPLLPLLLPLSMSPVRRAEPGAGLPMSGTVLRSCMRAAVTDRSIGGRCKQDSSEMRGAHSGRATHRHVLLVLCIRVQEAAAQPNHQADHQRRGTFLEPEQLEQHTTYDE